MSLQDKLESKRNLREEFYKLQDWLRSRINEVNQAPWRTETDFWCCTCSRDFQGTGFKIVRQPQGSVWFAYYQGVCPKGHRAIRYITDKNRDPYYYRSLAVKLQQRQYGDELLQPWHPRFRQLYPEQYAKLFGLIS